MNTTLHYLTPSSDERGRAPLRGASIRNISLRVALVRGPARLPWRSAASADAEALPASDVLQAARAVAGRPGAFLIGGGDPLRRGDLPTLLHGLVELRAENLGLCVPGAGVTTAVVEELRFVGVQRMSVPFHCARRDAHDWLVGHPGALRMALRAIRTCVDAGMPVEAEVVVTRPTMPHLAETIDVLTRVGVRTISLRRLTAGDVEAAELVLLSPRLSLLADDLERAATIALQRRARLVIRDFPLCVAPRLQRLFADTDAEVWLTPGATGAAMDARSLAPIEARSSDTRIETSPGCPGCPGAPLCAGAPADYIARFGWEEFADSAPIAERVQENVAAQLNVRPSGTMVFSWRGPRRVRCDGCADTPPSAGGHPAAGEHAAAGPEPTRIVRARLVEAARFRPALLRLVGAELLAHPNAAALLYDAVRLFSCVECAGEGSAIAKWSDLDLRRLKDLRRIDVAFYGPDATSHDAHCGIAGSFAATLRGVERLREHTAIVVGAYAVIHDARLIPRFVDAWSRGELPGQPQFRLAAEGSVIEDVVECARRMPAGVGRSALLAVLPHCLCDEAGLAMDDHADAESSESAEPAFGVAFGRRVEYTPRGSDPVGAFASCGDDGNVCTVIGCPGTAIGWQRNARSERWMQD
ncbi:MAG: radical SAM protein, partial [Candidatus Binatia bacterium]